MPFRGTPFDSGRIYLRQRAANHRRTWSSRIGGSQSDRLGDPVLAELVHGKIGARACGSEQTRLRGAPRRLLTRVVWELSAGRCPTRKNRSAATLVTFRHLQSLTTPRECGVPVADRFAGSSSRLERWPLFVRLWRFRAIRRYPRSCRRLCSIFVSTLAPAKYRDDYLGVG